MQDICDTCGFEERTKYDEPSKYGQKSESPLYFTELESKLTPSTPDMQTIINKFSYDLQFSCLFFVYLTTVDRSRFGVHIARSALHEIPYEIVRDALSSRRNTLYDYESVCSLSTIENYK